MRVSISCPEHSASLSFHLLKLHRGKAPILFCLPNLLRKVLLSFWSSQFMLCQLLPFVLLPCLQIYKVWPESLPPFPRASALSGFRRHVDLMQAVLLPKGNTCYIRNHQRHSSCAVEKKCGASPLGSDVRKVIDLRGQMDSRQTESHQGATCKKRHPPGKLCTNCFPGRCAPLCQPTSGCRGE